MPLLKNNVYALNGLTKHRLKNGQHFNVWTSVQTVTITTCNFRNFTSNEKSSTGLVLIVSVFLSVWPHTKNHKFLRIVYKRLPCDPRSLLSVYRSHLSELNTGIFCLICQITLGQFAMFFPCHSGITSQFGSTVIYLSVATNTFILKVLLC